MKKGFTLIELLIVIAIIAIIAGAVLVAINPAKRIGQANDAQRWAETNSILSAVNQFIVDNNGTSPTCTGTTDTLVSALTAGTPVQICGVGCAGDGIADDAQPGGADLIFECNLGADLVTATGLISSIPEDPQTGSIAYSGYELTLQSNGSICIEAVDKYEDSVTIKVCR